MLHRTRHLLIREQTAVINAIRAHLAEFGIVAPLGRLGVEALLKVVADPLPKIINLLADLKEEHDVLVHDGWVTYPMMKIRSDFEESLKKYPPIKMGTPDPYYPSQ